MLFDIQQGTVAGLVNGREKKPKGLGSIPMSPCSSILFFHMWFHAHVSHRFTICHQLAITGSKANQIQRLACEGLPKAWSSVQHWIRKVKHGQRLLGLKIRLAPPFLLWHQAQFSFLFFYIFFYLFICLNYFLTSKLILF